MVNRSVVASLALALVLVLAAGCGGGGGGDGPTEGVVSMEHGRASVDQLGAISAAMSAMKSEDAFHALLGWGAANVPLVTPSDQAPGRFMFPKIGLFVIPNSGTATCTGTSCTFDDYGLRGGYDVFTFTGAITGAGDSYTFDLAASFTAHFDSMDWELDGAVAITAAGVDGAVRHHGTGDLGPLGEQVRVTWDVALDYEAITLDAGGCPTGGTLHVVTAYEDNDRSFHVEGSLAFGPGCSTAR